MNDRAVTDKPDPRTPVFEVIRGVAREYEKQMQCNCDLDNWQPEKSTGHSHVCRIHKATINHLAECGIV